MDLLQKIGGRKFIMALLAIGAGMYLEVATPHGLSVNMAGLLVGLVGAFSAANYMATAKHFDYKGGDSGDDSIRDLVKRVQELSDFAKTQNNQEDVQKLIQLLVGLNDSIAQVQQVSGQIGSGIVNLSKEVKAVKSAVSQPSF